MGLGNGDLSFPNLGWFHPGQHLSTFARSLSASQGPHCEPVFALDYIQATLPLPPSTWPSHWLIHLFIFAAHPKTSPVLWLFLLLLVCDDCIRKSFFLML
ncbi:hypothetical protein PAXRUDRAFT_764728 [Paxillus rubicundulus Ve08.2h10]|uniref:Unplaced genomic scaffold scaffold_1131, whole genome shotgun sequence n=1 Tax=Paxillus rubicundulus Ve08.2h10 TaxID=930991 RepID=A0A0D0DA11_9AGAM|nr:hypothetical protein PAXRUDRAFT_764728 [Paxillus rubicundulus Ve08.2h10]